MGARRRNVAEKTQQRNGLQHSYDELRKRTLSGGIYQVKAIQAAETQRLEKVAQAVKTKPVHRRIRGITARAGRVVIAKRSQYRLSGPGYQLYRGRLNSSWRGRRTF